MALGDPQTCTDPLCEGTGYYEDGSICLTCLGGGSVPLKGTPLYLKTKFDALESWCTGVNQKLLYLKEKIDAL